MFSNTRFRLEPYDTMVKYIKLKKITITFNQIIDFSISFLSCSKFDIDISKCSFCSKHDIIKMGKINPNDSLNYYCLKNTYGHHLVIDSPKELNLNSCSVQLFGYPGIKDENI